MVISRDPPKPFAHIETHQERIFGFNQPNDSSQLWWSNYGEPWGFNALDNILEVGENLEGDPGKGLASAGPVLGIMKQRGFYALFGNSDATFSTGLFKLADVGCESERSVCRAYGMVAWVSRQGVYLWDGATAPRNISDGVFQHSNIKNVMDNASIDNLNNTVGFWYARMLGISFLDEGRTYMFDMRTQSWWPLMMTAQWVTYDFESDVPVVAVRGSGPNVVDAWFLYGSDLGNPLVATGVTRVSGDPSNTWSKTLTYMLVDAPYSGSARLTWSITADAGNQETVIPPPGPPNPILLDQGLPRHRVDLQQLVGIDFQLSFSLQAVYPSTIINRIAVYGQLNREFAPESAAWDQ